ncbi:MAG TPA: hypothetical protein VLB27_01950, partial [candidate division Zixibacteria bacterium]|nr:hypothetical protein [candidate division Zixibacteria bacterium]
DFERAYQEIKYAYERDPGNALIQFSRAEFQLYSGRQQDALEFIKLVEARTTIGLYEQLILMQLHALQGNREQIDRIIDEEFKATVRRDLQYPWHVAVAKSIIGDYDEALNWLEVAINNGFGNAKFLNEFDPYLAPLRQDPRFSELIRRAQLGGRSV